MKTPDSSLSQLLDLRHPDPHSLLGAHPHEGYVSFRVMRPGARRVTVILEDRRVPLHPRGDFPGIFEGRLTAQQVPPYSLEVDYGPSGTFLVKDPYAFLPTLGEHDLHFVGEGTHRRLWDRLGAHPLHHQGVAGTAFAVWAPSAAGVSVVGDFNSWDGRLHPMRTMGASGIWELFVPEVGEGTRYKFEVRTAQGVALKADPMAFRTEVPPQTASVVHDLRHYRWNDEAYIARRPDAAAPHRPLSIYEVHLGSWMRVPEQGNRPLTYRELAPRLADHVRRLGFTHVELMPVAEHPFGGSWGYQVTSYYAPSARFGHPDDFRFLVDTLHQAGIGVLIDWVPGHFPTDDWALARFDGTALYEHADPRKGAHPDWGTLIFNFGRNEVRNFLIANALFWIDQYHVDGLRVDAVASMLYLDYSRRAGEWIPNRFGGRENEEAISFLKDLNETVKAVYPGVMVTAEESTAWPKVSRPGSEGGLGFSHKWNMGWMHDTLGYFGKNPIHRKYHHHQLTFGLLYAYTEDFILPLSHDEVVHGKGSLASKMPGDDWQQLANLRALYAFMWAHPGKKLLFMGGELAQWKEWNNDASLDWHLWSFERHRAVGRLVERLNHLYTTNGALHENDFSPAGFQWIQADAVEDNVYAWIRRGKSGWREVVCVANLSPVVRHLWRLGVPCGGFWEELLNTDSTEFGGSGVRNGPLHASAQPWDGQPASIELTLPPLAVVYLTPAQSPGT